MLGFVATNWDPIISPLPLAVKLSQQLYTMIENHADNKKLAKIVPKEVNRINSNILYFSDGAEITDIASNVAVILLEDTADINESLGNLINQRNKEILMLNKAMDCFFEQVLRYRKI